MPEKRDVRRLILEAARKQFLADGFRKTTIESIAQEYKISKKTLYALFDSKAAIWKELVRIEAGKTVGYLKSHLPPEVAPIGRIEKLIGYYLRRRLQANSEAREHKLIAQLVGETDPEPTEDTSKRLREEALQQAFPMLVEELIREHRELVPQTSGSAVEDPALVTAMVVGAVIGASNFSEMSPDFVNEVCNMVRKMV